MSATPDILLVDTPVPRKRIEEIARQRFGDMLKAVVDIQRGVMAVGGELHADEEAYLLERGSGQNDLWGINIYIEMEWPEMVEFDSMINIRPSQKNVSQSVEDPETRQKILETVKKLIG